MGYSFVPGKDWKTPGGKKRSHGTMAAFIAGGEAFNQVQSGVAPKSTLLICSVGDSYSSQAVIGALSALITFKENGSAIDIISMSFGMEYDPDDKTQQTIRELIVRLKQLNVVMIACAGNYGKFKGGVLFPARLDEVICVGALNNKGYIRESNAPKGIDIYAPGEAIVHPTACGSQAERYKGTERSDGSSCAAPAIAGLMALVLQFSKKYVTDDQKRIKYRDPVYLKTTLFGEKMKEGDLVLLKPLKFFQAEIPKFELQEALKLQRNTERGGLIVERVRM